jgi:hypothetical protein
LAVYTIDALEDQRWDELTLRHPRAGIFHSRPWLQVLRQTYGYRPVVLTTTEPGRPLANGVVFCEVNSWFTGRRLVSLPFSDHCALLTNSTAEEAEIFAQLRRQVVSDRWRYAEIRPEEEMPEGALEDWQSGPKFSLHVLPLDMPLEKLFSNLHKDCIQRKIRRAERENLAYEYGRSDALLRKFFGLLLRTRRRHGLPPQPFR